MTTETLAAILMLENSSLPDILGLLLSVRTKSLSSLLDRHHAKLETSEAGPGGDREVGDIVTKLRDGLGLIVKTVAQVRESFGGGGESLLRLLEQVQNVTSDRSRQAVEEATNGFSTTPTSDPSSSSLHSILQTLPNAHHLLRYLPSGIVSFTPFIDTKSSRNHLPASTVEERTEEWFRESVKSLCAGAARMLEGTWTAKKLMKVKRDVLGFGDDVETVGRERRDLEAALVEVLKKRLEEIYKVRLEELVEGVRKFLDDGLRTLPDSSEGRHCLDGCDEGNAKNYYSHLQISSPQTLSSRHPSHFPLRQSPYHLPPPRSLPHQSLPRTASTFTEKRLVSVYAGEVRYSAKDWEAWKARRKN